MSKIKVKAAQIQEVRDYIAANPGSDQKAIVKATKIANPIVWEALNQLKAQNAISGAKVGRNTGYSVTGAKQAGVKSAASSTAEPKPKAKAKVNPEVKPVGIKSDKSKGRNFGRNFGRLTVNGVPLHKGKAADAIVRAYVKDKNPTYQELKAVFPDSLLKTYGIFTDMQAARQRAGRYFCNKSITLAGGKKIAVCSQFTTDNIQPLLNVARGLGFKIGVEK